MPNIYRAVELYMMSKGNDELFKMLRNLQIFLPNTDVYIRLINIVKRECNGKHFNTENFMTTSMNICNMLIIELSNIVKTNRISKRKIYDIEEFTKAKLIHS